MDTESLFRSIGADAAEKLLQGGPPSTQLQLQVALPAAATCTPTRKEIKPLLRCYCYPPVIPAQRRLP